MTHTLHRRGDTESLSRDIIFLTMPSKGINDAGSAPKLRRFFEIALACGAIRIGDCRSGNEYHRGGRDKVVNNVEDRAVIHAVFDDQDKAIMMLRRLKEAELGLSVVVSGLFDQVAECCAAAGLQRHTVEFSLGIWGRTERLPDERILELHTMCGHGMVTIGLIQDAVERIKAGRVTCEEAAEQLFRPCMCGIFNTARATELLRRIVEEGTARE